MKARPRLIPGYLAALLCVAAASALYAAAGLATRGASAQAAAKFNGRVAFTTNRDGIFGEIYLMNPDGGGQRNLTRSPASEVCPSFSPDGTRIAFVRDWKKIYVMNPDGSGQTAVLPNADGAFFSVGCVDWSPDGTKLVFSGIRSDDRNNHDVFVVGADGSGLARLTTDPANDAGARWSPDGRRIAFSSIRNPVQGEVNFEIYVMDADGSNQTRLTHNTKFDFGPAYSPDGSRIVFTSRRDGNFEVYSMKADGSDERRLTDNPEDDMDAEWSPDGTRLIFTSSRENRFGEIYTMRPDGTDLRNLTNADSYDMDASWQPLSEPLVFTSTPTPTPTPAPTPTPVPNSSETWEPYVPTTAQTELSVLGCGGRTFVKAKFTFNTGGYRVVEQGRPERSGNDLTADIKIERWTGVTTQALMTVERVYDLGTLAPGSYTFTLKSRGVFVRSIPFTAGAALGAASPADDPLVFVWQHYRDFLGRDPDDNGFRFWTVGMAGGCGANPACLERKRVDTSAAFFLSIEFQRTGFLVHRLYRASYGRVPRREEFLADTRQIARGVVVNAQGWEGLLADNTRAFLDEWVTRASYRFEFDQLSDSQYVERLFKNAGVTPDPNAGNSLVAALAEGRMTRAQVLRAVAEDAEFTRREFNPAFVLMQYFGYLQRNPNEGRDADWEGYNYWLAKLEQFGGDYHRAEMVRAFINSAEYRARFCGQ